MAYIVTHSGERVPIRISTALLRNDSGEVVGGVETFQDLSQIEELRKELESSYTFNDIIGRSKAMRELFRLLPLVADSSSTVLIEGASGTGKELVARAIHSLSSRQGERFVAINCGALPDTLLESELFGHVAGAFTDARRDKPGKFEIADRGTVFLDEIGDVSPAMQMRLLRVLQERCIEPLGGIAPRSIDVRVIAATNRDLSELVRAGRFREDLYYRVRVVHLSLPGLGERREDIPLLVDHFIDRFNAIENRSVTGVSDEVMARLMTHDFPGNVRELENIIEHAMVLCRGDLIEMHHLPADLLPERTPGDAGPAPMKIDSMEKLMITSALDRHHGHRRRAAADLGIHVSTLYRKMRSLGIESQAGDGRSCRHRTQG
jgi:transcriptional regulator with PAS, ATPase and Fis domain